VQISGRKCIFRLPGLYFVYQAPLSFPSSHLKSRNSTAPGTKWLPVLECGRLVWNLCILVLNPCLLRFCDAALLWCCAFVKLRFCGAALLWCCAFVMHQCSWLFLSLPAALLSCISAQDYIWQCVVARYCITAQEGCRHSLAPARPNPDSNSLCCPTIHAHPVTQIYTHNYTHTHANTYTHKYVHTHPPCLPCHNCWALHHAWSTHTHTHTYTHTHTHTHTHKYVHTHTLLAYPVIFVERRTTLEALGQIWVGNPQPMYTKGEEGNWVEQDGHI